MTESEWLASRDPHGMTEWLLAANAGSGRPSLASERKLRLIAVAICRLGWQLQTDPSGQKTVDVAERSADGRATEGELAWTAHEAESAQPRVLVGRFAAWDRLGLP